MKIWKFDKEPSFAELFDIFLYEFLYDKEKYVSEVIDLFEKLGVRKDSKILDTCAGTGFISLYLRKRGYGVDCMDLMQDEISAFRKNAKKLGVDNSIVKLAWKQIPKKYGVGKYDFLFCRGNSFIYAAGGWNEWQNVNCEKSLKAYETTLKIFHDSLKKEGYLYIDKFSDDESNVKEKIAKLRIYGSEEDLYFNIERNGRTRIARLMRIDSHGREFSVPNIAYNLSEEELENLLKKVGFRKVKKITLESEKHFIIWLAQK